MVKENEIFRSFNKLLKETDNTYDIDKAINLIDGRLKTLNEDAMAPQRTSNQITPKDISDEALKLSRMDAQQIQELINNKKLMDAVMPTVVAANTSLPQVQNQPSEAAMIAKQIKGAFASILIFTGVRAVIGYVSTGFKSAIAASKQLDVRSSMTVGGVPWYYLACGCIGIGTACYAILRKRNRKLQQMNRMNQVQTESIIYLTNFDRTFNPNSILSCISESGGNGVQIDVRPVCSIINGGLEVMSALGHQIDIDTGYSDKNSDRFRAFCGLMQQLGVYCLAQAKASLKETH